jgi:hypothetical protein
MLKRFRGMWATSGEVTDARKGMTDDLVASWQG